MIRRIIAKGRRARTPEPLDLELSLRFKFGEAPEDRITVMDQQPVPMVGSIFEHRDRVIRSFASLLVKNSIRSRKVVDELFPALRALRRARK